MSEQDLRTLIERASHGAEKEFRKLGLVEPVWLAIDRHGRDHVIPAFSRNKDTEAMMIRALFAIMDVIRYVLIDEAWILERSGGPDIEAEIQRAHKEGLAHHPDRQEVVMFSGEDHEGGIVSAHRPIVRPAQRSPYLGPLFIPPANYFKESVGRFVGLLPTRGARH